MQDTTGASGTELVLADIHHERIDQDAIWGEQNHPDGTTDYYAKAADTARVACKRAAAAGAVTWRLIFLEEVFEAMAEVDPVKLRAELVQAAAVAVAWVEAIDRRGGAQ